MDATSELPLGPFKRFGIFGGSFNPVHVGHLSIAQQILNALKLDRVFLMPAAQQPHKRDAKDMADAADRLEMCRLAVFNMRGLDVSDWEMKRGGVSYTVETARAMRAAYGPDAQIFFLIGSDSLADLPHWYEIQELLTLADFAIADRRETPIEESLWEKLRTELGARPVEKLRAGVVPVERVDISSTTIRRALAAGDKISGHLRRDVEEYIRKKGLYGAKPK